MSRKPRTPSRQFPLTSATLPMRPASLLWCLIAVLLASGAAAQPESFRGALLDARRLIQLHDVAQVTQAFETAARLAQTNEERGQAWFELSGYLMGKFERTAAAETLEKIAALEPPTQWHQSALQRLAGIYQQLGRLTDALQAHRRTCEIAGDDEDLMQMGLWGQARTYQQIGDSEAAEKIAQEMLDKFPAGRYASFASTMLIEMRLATGDVKAARKLAMAAATRENGDEGMLLRIADRLRSLDDPDGALELAQAFLAQHPDSVSGMQMLYLIHEQRDTVDEYEKQLAAKAKQAQDAVPALRQLAALYERQGRFGEALQAVGRLAELQPEDSTVPASAARLAARTGQFDKAAGYYEKALKMRPGDRALQTEMGDLYAEHGDQEKALQLWEAASGYDPRDLASARVLSSTLHQRGYFQASIDVLLKTREQSDDPKALAADLGQAYEALLFIDKAVAEYLTAITETPGMSSYVSRRLQKLAGDDAARPDLIDALEKRRADGDLPPEALVTLGLAYLKEGQSAKAAEAFGGVGDAPQQAAALAEAGLQLDQSGDAAGALAAYSAAASRGVSGEMGAQVALRRAALLLDGEDWRAAKSVLEDAPITGLSSDVADDVRLTLADTIVLWAGDSETAGRLYVTVAQGTGNDEHRRRAAWGLADCAFVAGQYDQAAKVYGELAGFENGLETSAAPFEQPTVFQPFVPIMELTGPERPMGPAYAAFQLAEIEFRLGHMKPAREQFERLASTRPGSPYANDALGRLLLIDTEFSGESIVAAEYLKALRLSGQGKLAEVKATLEFVVLLGAEEPLADDAQLLLARTVRRFGEGEDALEQYEALRRTFPDSSLLPGALLEAARLATSLPGGREKASELLRDVRARFPLTPEAVEARLALEKLNSR